MFEYLASGKILISSNRKVLKEILKNRINCLIVKKNKKGIWAGRALSIVKFENQKAAKNLKCPALC